MSKVVDLTGQKFGRLTVVERAGNDKHGIRWLCKCECGNEKIISGRSLKSGDTRSCGCLNKEEKTINLVGKRFGKLVVIAKAENDKNKVQWLCKCDCGNEKIIKSNLLLNGNTMSCGCLRVPNINIGNRFGKLTVKDYIGKDKRGKGLWECQCDCGNIIIVNTGHLVGDHTKSCGCLKKEKLKERIDDLTGQKFGRLTVVKIDEERNTIEQQRIDNREILGKGGTYWKCKCDCGSFTTVTAGSLKSGKTKSCGCLQKEKAKEIHYNPNITDEERERRRNIEGYSDFIRTVLNRDNYTCRCCGEQGKVVHHLDGYDWCKEKRIDVSNGITLCKKCHKWFHGENGMGGNTRKQFEYFLMKHYNKSLEDVFNKVTKCKKFLGYDIIIEKPCRKVFSSIKELCRYLKKEYGWQFNEGTMTSYVNTSSPIPKNLKEIGLHRSNIPLENYKVQTGYKTGREAINSKAIYWKSINGEIIVRETLSEFSKIDAMRSPSTVCGWLSGKKPMPQEWIDRGLRYVNDTEKKYEAQTGMLKGRNNPSAKKVICEEKEFSCIKECAEFYNIKSNNMACWLRGERKMPQRFVDLGLRYATEEDIYTYEEYKEEKDN